MSSDSEPNVKAKFNEYLIDGFTKPKYVSIANIFRKNFQEGLEPAGASFSVFHKGQLIINLFGGYKDVSKKEPWREDTTSVIFSTTKSLSASVLAYVLDKNNVSYDTNVTEIWPEFGKNGKEDITILDCSLHRAGLAYSDEILNREHITNPEKISIFFENAFPMIEKNKVVYHALTFGLLIDQIVRRIDGKKRGIAEIVQQDFVEKFGIPYLSIGIKSEKENEKVAVLTDLNEEEVNRQGLRNPEALKRYLAGDNIHNEKLYKIFPWITTDDYNVIENRLLPMPSNMGIANSEGLAHFHSLIANKKIFTEKMHEILSKPVLEEHFDHAIGYNESKGFGFQYTKNKKGQWIFGHSGFGGQNVRVDVHNELSFAYISNGLKIADADLVEPWKNLIDELYNLIE